MLTLLHCTSSYPTALADANLLAMEVLKQEFNLPVGFSDHTLGCVAPLAAASMGAVIIEKHVSPNTQNSGPTMPRLLIYVICRA